MKRSVWLVLRRRLLGATLIVAASAVLLFSDRKRDEAPVPRAALPKLCFPAAHRPPGQRHDRRPVGRRTAPRGICLTTFA